MMAHIDVRDLRVVFRGSGGVETPAVDGVSFALHRGETLGIVGESGSGKSTVARALLGFARPGARFASGSVQVGGTDVLTQSEDALRTFRGHRAAMVPQNPLSSLTPHLTVGAQLVELLAIHAGLTGRAARARALELMEATDLPDPPALFGRYPHEISGGQRQRVVIAAALVARPELIVLDEPTTALDKTVEARVLELVRRVQVELDATLIYVSHDLNVIASMCQRLLVMRHGRVVEAGSTGQVFERPGTDYARALVEAIPRLSARAAPSAGNPSAQTRLRVQSVSFGYAPPGGLLRRAKPGPRALDRVSFTLSEGETLGVVGESGSGKSTLASLIAGAVAGHQGEILLDAERPLGGLARTRAKADRRRIQMVFQDPLSSLNPTQSVEEIIARPLRLYFGETAAGARARATDLLGELDLGPEFLARRPRQLSGGQQQRVAIARALAADPDILLCDEITSALDVTIQAHVLALLRRLQQQRGLACLFISHDLAVVSDVAHQILVLERGQVRDLGATASVLGSTTSAYTARLLRAHRTQAEGRSSEEEAPRVRLVQ